MKKAFKITLMTCVVLFFTGILSVTLVINHYKKQMPDIENLIESYTPSIPTKVYDMNGVVIDELYRESRIPAKFDEIPENLKDAFVAIEDRRFYNHYGIDPIGLMRAIVVNIKSRSKSQGASTFTQQLARNAFLNHEKKLSRKIKEAILTVEIEKRYTKNEIFVKYLNEIYFGEGDYGVKSAAKSLFKKDIRYINISEAAMLAGIPNRPGYYNPRKNLDASLERMRLVLSQMKRYGFISEDEYQKAINHKFILEEDVEGKIDPVTTTIVYEREKVNKSLAPSFTDLVLDYLQENFDEELIYNGGLQVFTTLNYNMQKVAQQVFNEYQPIVDNPELEGAMVTINSSNGYITSIIGGRNFIPGNFNRAISSSRQIGSSFKPFVYLSAIMKGYKENTIIEDSRALYDNGWAPKNVTTTYKNNQTLLEAFNRSANSVAIKLLENITPKFLNENVKKLDIGMEPTTNLSAALGALTATPLNLSKAFAIFSNGGYIVEPMCVLEVRDKDGNTLIKNTPSVKKVFDTRDIALTTNLLVSSVKYGTSKPATVVTKKGKNIEQGGKTGTTNDSLSVWYAGITPEYVTTVYLGYDDNKEIPRGTGGGLAAPIWKRYYEEIINAGYYSPSKFEFIDSLVASGDLYYQNLDPDNGLLSTKWNARKFLMESHTIEIEQSSKYRKNIAEILYN
ncbi:MULTISPECIES: transglycosylase domain-containing protein [Fusobacterium]|uniref:transglycosylase domain-containing protein n=1 Tax=Fusobacterium TaxID=848 RepID=UPI001476E998|nr:MULTISPECIES: transglycosylase domain-containing protein [Fusobacterium]NME35220.1 penicillin-binding protein [Fusobacterium sp. FSA-380-WT-3A]